MKKNILLFLPLAALFMLSSCVSIRVVADYDNKADFNTFKTYAFYKTGVDQAQISDLDKKRILRAIESEMGSKGFVKSESPDLLISIFTREQARVDIYNNVGWGWGPGWGWGWGPGWGYWNPWMWGGAGWGGSNVSTSTEGSLYIDIIDTKSRELIWQGKGVGTLKSTKNIEKKEKRIQEFVTEILEKYPPDSIASN